MNTTKQRNCQDLRPVSSDFLRLENSTVFTPIKEIDLPSFIKINEAVKRQKQSDSENTSLYWLDYPPIHTPGRDQWAITLIGVAFVIAFITIVATSVFPK